MDVACESGLIHKTVRKPVLASLCVNHSWQIGGYVCYTAPGSQVAST